MRDYPSIAVHSFQIRDYQRKYKTWLLTYVMRMIDLLVHSGTYQSQYHHFVFNKPENRKNRPKRPSFFPPNIELTINDICPHIKIFILFYVYLFWGGCYHLLDFGFWRGKFETLRSSFIKKMSFLLTSLILLITYILMGDDTSRNIERLMHQGSGVVDNCNFRRPIQEGFYSL